MTYTDLEIDLTKEEYQSIETLAESLGITPDHYVADALWKTLIDHEKTTNKALMGLLGECLERLEINSLDGDEDKLINRLKATLG